MSDDDINLPTPPENLNDSDLLEPTEPINHSELESDSKVALQLNFDHTPITKEDLSHLTLNKLEESLLVSELQDSAMYLKNIHKGFKFARSTRSLINLVGAGLAVHKHRRSVLKEIKESKKDPFEMDEYGNLKSS